MACPSPGYPGQNQGEGCRGTRTLILAGQQRAGCCFKLELGEATSLNARPYSVVRAPSSGARNPMAKELEC